MERHRETAAHAEVAKASAHDDAHDACGAGENLHPVAADRPEVRLADDQLEALARRVVELLRLAPAASLPSVPAPALVDARGAARYLGMSRATFDRKVRRYVNAVDTGGHLRYRPEDLDRWCASRSRPVPPRGVTPRPLLRGVDDSGK